MLSVGALQAQVDKGVTRTGKAVDCSTIDPSVDKTVSERGAIVTHPRVTRNGKIIKEECCPELAKTSFTDTLNCVSISMGATISNGTIFSAVLQVFKNADYTGKVGNDITATVDAENGKITAKASNLNCNTRYYLRLKINNRCEYDWTDSTRDMTIDQGTSCLVSSALAMGSDNDRSHEHLIPGTNKIDTVYDMQGNDYAVVQIGNQCWTRQNMRCTLSPRNDSITNGNSKDPSYKKPYLYNYSTDQVVTNLRDRGYLYNWPAAMDTSFSTLPTKKKTFSNRRGICPKGWHLPTDVEWTTMELLYLTKANGDPITLDSLNKVKEFRGKGSGKLTGGCDWNTTSTVGAPGNYNYAERDISHFYALPAGYHSTDGDFKTSGTRAMFWSASLLGNTENDFPDAYARYVSSGNSGIERYNSNLCDGFSVRCVRNADYGIFPTVDMVTCMSMDISAQIVGLSTVTDKTVCAYKNEDFSDASPVCVESSDIHVSGTTLTATISGLDCNTMYYVKVTVSDGTHSVDGTTSDSTRDMTLEKATFCTVSSAQALVEGSSDHSHEHLVEGSTTEIDSVYDHEGNRYAVVQIGDQCWLKENMRCTTSPNGYLQAGSGDWVYYPRYYQPGTASVSQCGYLYNWAGAMDVEDGSAVISLPVNLRGICPAGWHVPDTTEWITLRNTIVGNSTSYHYYDGYYYYADNTPIATILASSCDWKIDDDDPSNNPDDYTNSLRNSSGFSLVPCPNYFAADSYNEEGKSCYLWSANSLNESKAARMSLHFLQTGFGFGRTDDGSTPYKQAGRNVRCLRDQKDTITFMSHGGTGTMEKQLVNTGITTPLNTNLFTRDNFKFSDWSTDPSGCDIHYVDGANITTHGNVTLYAQWDTSFCQVTSVHSIEAGADQSHERSYKGSSTKIDSVYDHEGNAYGVVQIGGKCWMKENMRAKTEPNSNVSILENPASNTLPLPKDVPHAYYYSDSVGNYAKYGCLYNFPAAMNISDLGTSFETSHRGICPNGWHIPTRSEWLSMMDSLNIQRTTNIYSDNGFGLGKLAGGCVWESFEYDTYAGNYSYVDRNVSGFTALPAGYYNNEGKFVSIEEVANFWSATADGSDGAYGCHFSRAFKGVYASALSRDHGISVRCVRNN